MLISVVIITLNESVHIARCIQSVKAVADEVIVVADCAANNTAAIAQSLGARVVQRNFKDYVDQKNAATDEASYDLVLSLDADEALSDELSLSIQIIRKTGPMHTAYRLKSKTNYCGKWLRHGNLYADKNVRLFDRTKGRWRGNKIKEQWMLYNANRQIGDLAGSIHHYTFSAKDHYTKIQQDTNLMATALAEKGIVVSPLKIWVSPVLVFLHSYVLKAGILDGRVGLQICRLTALATHLKYKKAKALMMDDNPGVTYAIE